MSKENSNAFRALPHFAALMLIAGAASAQVYSWAGEKGVTCNEERDYLARMREAELLYTLNERGERVYQDDAEREQAIARQEKLVAQYCKD